VFSSHLSSHLWARQSGTFRDAEGLTTGFWDTGGRSGTVWDDSEPTLNPQVLGSKPRGRPKKYLVRWVATEVGHADLAMRYFRESLYSTSPTSPTHGNTVDGAHIANVGGVWACRRTGSPVSATRDQCSDRAATAGGWQAMRFSVHRRGGDIAIAVDPSGATVTVESGEPVPILADGVITEVAAGSSLRVDVQSPVRTCTTTVASSGPYDPSLCSVSVPPVADTVIGPKSLTKL
jgi:Glycosyl hydrolase family 65, C-terminal domain